MLLVLDDHQRQVLELCVNSTASQLREWCAKHPNSQTVTTGKLGETLADLAERLAALELISRETKDR